MATITVKKKKPLSLKAPMGEESMDETSAATVAPAGGPALAGAPGMAAVSGGPSYTLWGILALVATVCFVVVVLMQWVELTGYDKPPAVFPKPALTGGS